MSVALLLRLALLAGAVLAQDPCESVPGGCGGTGGNPFTELILAVASLFVSIAAGGSVLCVMAGGFLMMLDFGDGSRSEQGKGAIIWALIGFGLTLASQTILSIVGRAAQEAEGGDVVSVMASIVSSMRTAFTAVFVMGVVVAGIRMVIARGQPDEFGKAKTALTWLAIGAIVVNLAYSLVSIVGNLGL